MISFKDASFENVMWKSRPKLQDKLVQPYVHLNVN